MIAICTREPDADMRIILQLRLFNNIDKIEPPGGSSIGKCRENEVP